MSLDLTPYKTTNPSYFPKPGGGSIPAWDLSRSGNPWDDCLDAIAAYVNGLSTGGLADPGSNGIVKRTALNVTAEAVAGTDYQVPLVAGTDYVVPHNAPNGWNAIGNSGTAPTYRNSWGNFGSGNAAGAYRLDADGFVTVRLCASGGTVSSGITIFSLPAGFRPPLDVSVACVDAANQLVFRLNITSGGDFNAYGMIAGAIPDSIFRFATF